LKSFLPIAALLLQAGTFPSLSNAPAPVAAPQNLRYVRALTLPPNASGIACTILDANVYAHIASPSADDLRVFRLAPHTSPEEVPFVVSYSEAQPTDAQTATVHNLALHNNTLSFDLDMPARPYTEVDLNLDAHNFLATAEVSDAAHHPLGTFTLFDLTDRHLARSTTLGLQETSAPQLHLTLRLRTPDNKPFPNLTPAILKGATVPASREAQTLYTVVASTNDLTQQGTSSIAQLTIPAHLPVERVQFVLDPAYKSDFLRTVSVTAAADTNLPDQPQEVIDGQIGRVTRPADPLHHAPAISAAQLSLPAVIASNLHDRANLRIAVDNASQPPLPLRAVQLAMRQRTLCFHADPNATYTLRYGDNTLRAPVYDLGDLTTLPAKPIPATLEAEDVNPSYLQRPTDTTYHQRNPNLFWIALIASVAVSGSLFSRHATRQGRRR
jgi:hypothetical protein